MKVDWDKILSPPTRETDASVNQTGNLTKAEIEKSNQGSKNTDAANSLSIDTKNSSTPKNCNTKLENCIDQCRKENPYSSTWSFSFTSSFVQAKRNRCYDSCRDSVLAFGCDSKIDNIPYNEYSP
jgi:hypothetical protein